MVALAIDDELESAVALKILHTRNRETENKFLEEARMLRRIQSLNVIAVHDIGRLHDGSPYFVLDYASRGTLAERLVAGIVGPELIVNHRIELLNFVDGLTDGLTAIHQAGLVHRDIKPANILFCGGLNQVDTSEYCAVSESFTNDANQAHNHLLEKGERVLVGDLGIAKDLSRSTEHPTIVGGTPFYLAPEQKIPEQSVTTAADVYSATALLWRLLVNETPPSSTEVEQRLQVLPEVLVQQGWKAFFNQGMSAIPAKRYQTADDWRWAVHDIMSGSSATVMRDTSLGTLDEPSTDICPYKGLAPYEEGDSRFFCGRDVLVNQLSRRLLLESVLVVGGPSGSGKSSLVRAGLVPLLKQGVLPGSEHWHCLVMTPGSEPVRSLKTCLESVGGIDSVIGQTVQLERTIVLVVDQFEEIFTLATESDRNLFLQLLSELTDIGGNNVKLTLAVRADFYSECARAPWLAAKITSNQVLVGPMTKTELRQAITEPAYEAGYLLEKGLVSSIIEEAGNEIGSLPLVAHALVETWVRRTDRTLTLDGFRSCGGVAGAISQTADATFEHKLDDEGREATRGLMLKLVNPGDGTPDTRRVIDRTEIVTQGDMASDACVLGVVIKKLTAARLLTVDDSKVQIAHEALLRNWPRLRQWIDESRDDLRMRRRISLQAEEWQAEGRERDLLYRGSPLFSALDWREHNPSQLGALEHTFLDTAKRRHTEIEEQAAQGRRKNRRVLFVGIALLTLLAFGATLSSIFAYRAFKDSQQNAQVAQKATETANFRFAGALGAAAYGHHAKDPRLSLVLASEAIARTSSQDTARSPTFDTRAAMVSARQVLAKDGPFLRGSPIIAGNALSIALNPLGSILAIGSVDGEIRFLDVGSYEPLQSVSKVHQGGVRDMEFSPDGKSMVSAGADGKLFLWKQDNDRIWKSSLLGETGDVVPDIDFHPNGEFVVSANHDATLGVWFIDGRTSKPRAFSSGIADINTLAISRDGQYMVAANADKTITGWNLNTGEMVMEPLSGVHSSHLRDVEFSPSANSFFTMTTDGKSKMLSFPDGEILQTVFDAKDAVGALAINAASGILIGASKTGQLISWSLDERAILHRSAMGHSQEVKHQSMTRDERLIATLGRDQLIRFWTINDNYRMGQQLQNNSDAAKSVAISPDGNLIASGDANGSVRIWRLYSNDTTNILVGHEAQVWALSFSMDNQFLASADRLGKVNVWDVRTRRVVQMINSGKEAVWSVEFTQDDALLVATDSGVLKYSREDGRLLDKWKEPEAKVTRLSLSPDRSRVITTFDNGNVSVRVVSDDSNEQLIDVGDDLLWSAAINHSGSLLAAASSDETVYLFDLKSGNRLATLTGHRGGATNVAFLEDGSTLLVSDRRGLLHWWDIETSRRLAAPWRGHRKSVWRMALHPDGERVATAGDDGAVWLWDALSVDRACEIGFSSFDAGQKIQYLGDAHTMQACQ